MKLIILLSVILCGCSYDPGYDKSKVPSSQKITTKAERSNEAFRTGKAGLKPGTAQIGAESNTPAGSRFPW